MNHVSGAGPLEMWGGVECTVNRVGDRWFDQVVRSGHDLRSTDLERFASLGIRALRYPVLWERLAPRSLDAIDWRWADERLARLRDYGIRPIVGLVHHGSGPAYTSLLDPAFPEKLAAFARAVARRYPWIEDYTPVNEPLTTARFSALYGHWFPHRRDDRSFVRAFLNQMRGIVLAMRAIRETSPQARLIQTEDCGLTFGAEGLRGQIEHEGARRWLTWDVLTGALGDGHPLHRFLRDCGMTADDEAFFAEARCAPDVIGLNYYLTSDRYLDDNVDRYPASARGGNGRDRYADVNAVRVRAEGVAGHEAHLLSAWERYRCPLAITEVHLACTREEQMRWLAEAWNAATNARAQGADVRAVTAWALLGSYDWNSLVTCDDGCYEPGVFDLRSESPRPTALARVVQALADTGRPPSHAVLAQSGWWHRPDRLIFPEPERRIHTPGSGDSGSAASPQLLLIGASGTLGRAFQRICRDRGLNVRTASRLECDITERPRAEKLIAELRPWAVINASGYVRVDDAEGDVDRCRAANVSGPFHLASICSGLQIPLVTFSSDLVFDGSVSRPYMEDDAPRPLNVYGATKVEGEQMVLSVMPSALVVRTSAFFGPWDEANFAVRMFRALEQHNRFPAAFDAIVSPTYVPHLVHATLDLLIDEETGVWHLANAGAVSWFDFARELAARGGARGDLVTPVPAREIWAPALRPRYSALGSRRGRLMPPLESALEEFLRDANPARLPATTAPAP